MDWSTFEIGKNALGNYLNIGSNIFIIILCIMVWKYRSCTDDKYENINPYQRGIIDITALLLMWLILPGTSNIINALCFGEIYYQNFLMVPTGLIFAMTVAMIWNNYITEKKDKIVFVVLVILILFSGISIPWTFTYDNISLTTNCMKISAENLEVMDYLVGETAILPRRITAQAGEYESKVLYVEGSGTYVNESSPSELADFALNNNCSYLVLDKKRLKYNSIDEINNILINYNYTFSRDFGRYICYQHIES